MELRKCVFKKWIEPHTEVIANQEVRFGGFFQQDFETEGLFHQWGCSFVDFESGPGNYTTAIVETSDGLIYEIDPKNLKFINE